MAARHFACILRAGKGSSEKQNGLHVSKREYEETRNSLDGMHLIMAETDRSTRSRRSFVSKMSVYTVEFICHARKRRMLTFHFLCYL